MEVVEAMGVGVRRFFSVSARLFLHFQGDEH